MVGFYTMKNGKAFLFPGQGSQYPGMGKDLYDAYPAVRKLFELASDITCRDICTLLFEGTPEDLKSTENAQIAITLHDLAAASVLRELGLEPDMVAGFSLGEFPALAVSGVLDAETVFRIVKIRGEAMEEASRHVADASGNPGMAAVMGLDFEEVVDILKRSGIRDLYAANYNSPVQTVVSGTAAALKEGEIALKSGGAKRIIPLKVSGPFHTPLMQDARDKFEAGIKDAVFSDPKIRLYSNVTGKAVANGSEAKRLSVLQITSPVLWVSIEKNLIADGCTHAIEAGPGSVLAGLFKAVSDTPCSAAGRLEDIKTIVSEGENRCC